MEDGEGFDADARGDLIVHDAMGDGGEKAQSHDLEEFYVRRICRREAYLRG